MNIAITTIFCLSDDFIRALDIKQDPQQKMSDSEVVTIGLVACRYFSGNLSQARTFLYEHGYMSYMLSESRLVRRLHRIPDTFWHVFLGFLSYFRDSTNSPNDYIVDSFPIPVCHNIRISRRHLFREKEFIGYCASKETFFCGVKVHLIISSSGQPKEFIITPASEHDIKAFKKFSLHTLCKNSRILGDKAYNDYQYEDDLRERSLSLCVERKVNSRRSQDLFFIFRGKKIRKYIETVFSQLNAWIKGRIHAVTNKGFKIKISLLLIAFSMLFCFP